MKRDLSNKYNLAWFKLSEFISRGEKEKALGIFRLLSHSIEDQAFINKLEGDILSVFNDVSAIDKYKNAAHIYSRNDKVYEAAALYQQLLIQSKTNSEDFTGILIELYKKVEFDERAKKGIRFLLEFFIDRNEIKKALELLDDFHSRIPESALFELRKDVVFGLIKRGLDKELIIKQVKILINNLLELDNIKLLNFFLKELEVFNEYYYSQVLAFLEK